MIITLENKSVEIKGNVAHGIDVRCKLSPERYTYQLWRENDGRPNEQISDGTPIRNGQKFYAVPPGVIGG